MALPGSVKTAALRVATAPTVKLQAEYRALYKTLKEIYDENVRE